MLRFQNFLHGLTGFPWMENDQVTVDYYPYDRTYKRFPLLSSHGVVMLIITTLILRPTH